ARVDLATGAMVDIAAVSSPTGIALDHTGRTAYVVDSNGGRVFGVDLSTGTVSAVASGLAGPIGIALDPAGATAFVTENGASRLSAVDLASGTVHTIASGLY